ncbi:MAG: RNA polymerase sigma factor [Bdellovibrionota bacterium]
MTDQEIVDGLKSGAPEAFRVLYEAQGSSVFSYLARVTGRREMAEELTQETFLTVIRKIGFFKSRIDGGLRAWVFRIATHLAIDVLRREKRIKLPGDLNHIGDPASNGPNPHEELERIQSNQIMQDALDRIAPAQRMMFLLHEQEDLSCMEISLVCGCSENAVKQGLFRARSALRRLVCD